MDSPCLSAASRARRRLSLKVMATVAKRMAPISARRAGTKHRKATTPAPRMDITSAPFQVIGLEGVGGIVREGLRMPYRLLCVE
jgi:hypothetical protein